jgi:hypothetical protein
MTQASGTALDIPDFTDQRPPACDAANPWVACILLLRTVVVRQSLSGLASEITLASTRNTPEREIVLLG